MANREAFDDQPWGVEGCAEAPEVIDPPPLPEFAINVQNGYGLIEGVVGQRRSAFNGPMPSHVREQDGLASPRFCGEFGCDASLNKLPFKVFRRR
jgi:hypothetical protein